MTEEVQEIVKLEVPRRCKYCGGYDKMDNMHQDIYTKEYYHEDCRPEWRDNGRGRPKRVFRSVKYDGIPKKV